MAIVFCADAVGLNGAAVLGHARLDPFAVSWHDGIAYAGFQGIKDLQADRGDLLILAEGASGSRHVCRLIEGRFLAGCVHFRSIDRPICLLIHGDRLLIGHVGGIASIATDDLHRATPEPIRPVEGRVLSLVAFRGRILASVQSHEQPFTQVIDVETGAVAWSDTRDRLFSKLFVWQDRLAASDAENAEIVFLDAAAPSAIPLGHGYLRALQVLADGSLLVARNRWRPHLRRHGARLHPRAPLPAWWAETDFVRQRGSELLVLDGDGRIVRQIPFTQIAEEVSGAAETDAVLAAGAEEAAHLRAIHQRAAQEHAAQSMHTRLRRLKMELAEAKGQQPDQDQADA